MQQPYWGSEKKFIWIKQSKMEIIYIVFSFEFKHQSIIGFDLRQQLRNLTI